MLVDPDGVVELRALECRDNYGRKSVRGGFFDHDHLDQMAAEALKLSGKAKGVYFTVNPLTPDLLARCANRVDRCESGSLAADGNVLRRRWLLVDLDPKRISGVSASDAEKDAAWTTTEAVKSFLAEQGWPDPVSADSGNGYHLLYRVDLPTDDGGLVKRCLKSLAARFDAAAVTVDTAVYNPSRICKLYGTLASKGDSTDDRPHRLARVLDVPDELAAVPTEALSLLAAECPTTTDTTRTTTANGRTTGGDPQTNGRAGVVDRATRYVSKIPGGVSGQFGSNPTFHVACVLVVGFDLTRDEAYPILVEYNRRCEPPWTEQELWHKLDDANKVTEPRGKLLRAERANGRTTAVSTAAPTAVSTGPPPLAWRPFPVAVLPEPLRAFVAATSVAVGCDPSYVALPMLSAIAAAVGTTRVASVMGNWVEPAVLWTAIVGESGTTKSPALDLVVAPLVRRMALSFIAHEADVRVYKDALDHHEVDLAAWKAKKTKTGDPKPPKPPKPEPPVQHRTMVGDVTVEALAVLLLDNPRGLLLCDDELGGWLKSFDAYKGGKGGDAQKWIKLHGARPLTVDRKGGDRRAVFVPRAAVSVTGGIQPDVLRRTMSGEYIECGLAARLLMAYPPRRERQLPGAKIPESVEAAWARVLDGLAALEPDTDDDDRPCPRPVHLSPEAQDVFVAWVPKWAREQLQFTGALAAVWSKLEGAAVRLALLMHQAEAVAGTSNPDDPVEAHTLRAGIHLTEWFGHEALRLYGFFAESAPDRERRELAELVTARFAGRVTARDLMHASRKYQPTEAAEAALDALVAAGLGRWETVETGGRPRRDFVLSAGPVSPEAPESQGILTCGYGDTGDSPENALPAPDADRVPF